MNSGLREREESQEKELYETTVSPISFLVSDLSLPIFLSMFNEVSLKMQSFHWQACGVTQTHTHSHEHTVLLRSEHQLIL